MLQKLPKEESETVNKYYAHSKASPVSGEPLPVTEWQPLDEHLKNVAELAAKFAEPFGAQDWARLAVLWHDLGKIR